MRRKEYVVIKNDTQNLTLRPSVEQNYERRSKKRCGSVRTDESRKWDEGPRWEVEGNQGGSVEGETGVEDGLRDQIVTLPHCDESDTLRCDPHMHWDPPGDLRRSSSRLSVDVGGTELPYPGVQGVGLVVCFLRNKTREFFWLKKQGISKL
jgi:hypothetical protein